jgi:ribosomal-protein-alanine N-acetyltransferase
MEVPTKETSRLILRPWSHKDVEPLQEILGVEGVLQYFPRSDPPDRDRVEKFVAAQIKHWEDNGFGWWALEQKDKSGLMGWCGLQFLPETNECEVGFLLGKPFWKRGFATEAARFSLEHGFEILSMETIVAIVHPENAASIHVIEKLGMAFDKRTRYFDMDCFRYYLNRASFKVSR